MKKFNLSLLRACGLCRKVLTLAKDKGAKLYLVGGILRDALLDREKENPDIDFCLKNNAIAFAGLVAKKLGAGFVVLDRDHGCARVVKKLKNIVYTLDFADFRGKTIDEDLRRRDFSINSLAMPLEALFTRQDLDSVIIDPCLGRKDLKAKIIRLCNKEGFDQDPLRILRAFSLAAIFDFKINKDTLKAIVRKKSKITGVSRERVRDELFKIFSTSRAYKLILTLDKNKILELLFPQIKPMRRLSQGPYHHLDVWAHSLETLKNLELILNNAKRNGDLLDYLNLELSCGRKRSDLLKLVAFLHDIAKPNTLRIKKGKVTFYGHESLGARMLAEVAFKLKLSTEEIRALKLMVFCHLRPGYLANNPVLTQRAKFKFFRDADKEAASILLLSLADQRSTHGYLTIEKCRGRHERLIKRLIKEYFFKLIEKKKPRLLNGNDLMKHFKLEPGALIGKLLRELEEAQAIGRIKTRQEALRAAFKLLKKNYKNQKQ
jgi:putative nucleotidyltransferase with HDIG domain